MKILRNFVEHAMKLIKYSNTYVITFLCFIINIEHLKYHDRRSLKERTDWYDKDSMLEIGIEEHQWEPWGIAEKHAEGISIRVTQTGWVQLIIRQQWADIACRIFRQKASIAWVRYFFIMRV